MRDNGLTDIMNPGGMKMVDKEKQYKRQEEWTKANKDVVKVKIPKGTKEAWQAAADAAGLSLTQWIIQKCQGD